MHRLLRLASYAVAFIITLAIALWATATLFLTGSDHSGFDLPRPVVMNSRKESAAHRAIANHIAADIAAHSLQSAPDLNTLRAQFDARGRQWPMRAVPTQVDAAGVRAEWVMDPAADPNRRVLFIHGGGYSMGSPASHRPITARLSQITRSAVLAIDYRLLPEHARTDGIEDCWTAYRWMIDNGPAGQAPARALFVVGDSAGGNLALVTIARARDEHARAADAVVVLSPQTDTTLASPSLVGNASTDIVQREGLGPLVGAPKAMSLWMLYWIYGINPRSPLVSPLRGNLSNLPPTLLQVSATEMFFDDVVRYANKARAQGSVAVLQTWPHTMHVWQAFAVPEADEAFEAIRKFVQLHTPANSRATTSSGAGTTVTP